MNKMQKFKENNVTANGGSVVIFSEDPRIRDPKPNVDRAVANEVGNDPYMEFIEDWLDNPWVRVVLKNIDITDLDFHHVEGFDGNVDDAVIDLHNEGDEPVGQLHFLFVNPDIQNPSPLMETALLNVVGNNSYNAFVDSHLDNPWIKIVIFGLNNLFRGI